MIYVFGEWELDLDLYELRCTGQLIKLQPQVFNVFAYLVQHRNRVVPRQEMLAQLWPEQNIGSSALERCIMAARKAVGDTGGDQSVIKTLYRRGYRFVRPIKECVRDDSGDLIPIPVTDPLDANPNSVPEETILPQFTLTQPLPAPQNRGDQLHLPMSSLSETASVWAEAAPALGAYQLVTVLSCALVNPSPSPQHLGPDHIPALLGRFFHTALHEVQRYGGWVAQFLDNGFLALFGASERTPNHALQAVRTALALQHLLSGSQLAAQPFAIRSGLHTGNVIEQRIGPEQRAIYLAADNTRQWAEHLRCHSEPGAILMSESTYHMMRNAGQSEQASLIPVETRSISLAAYAVFNPAG